MTRFKLWKDWNKHCLNHPLYKFFVLIGLARSPSFEMHHSVIEKLNQFPAYEYTVLDEKPEKSTEKTTINSIMCSLHGFNVLSWQYWVYFWMLVLCFVSGANYRKREG